jgi:hypothetical protein
VAAVERTNARGVVIGALMNADGAAARSVASSLRAANPDLVIAFGGAAAPDPGAGPFTAGAGPTIRLPDDPTEGVAALRAALEAASAS